MPRVPDMNFRFGHSGSIFRHPVRLPPASGQAFHNPPLFGCQPVCLSTWVLDHPLPTSTPAANAHTQLWPRQPRLYFTPVVASTPLPPAWEPGTFPPEPLGISVPLHLHPHLTPNPLDPSIPTLLWDVIHPPELARIYSGRHLLLPVDLKAKAVRPKASELYITSDHPVLASWMTIWGPIMVRNSDISLFDVLHAIYTYLQEPLKPQEIERLKSVPGNEASVQYAAHQRATDSYELYSVAMKSGFRRVDVLGGHRMFVGLRPVVFQDHTWKLFLSLRPGDRKSVV